MSLLAASTVTLNDGFPRVSGDEPRPRLSRAAAYWFSPRERG